MPLCILCLNNPPFALQKHLLLLSTLLQINAQHQNPKTHHTQRKEEIKRRRRIARWRRIDNRTGDNRPNKRRRLPDDTEETEEKEFMAARRDFGNHDLGVTVPGADEEAIECLVELYSTC